MTKPTTEQLAQIAAGLVGLDPKLTLEEALSRAKAIWEASDKIVRAEEIADERLHEQVGIECERLDIFGLGVSRDTISLSQAFELADEIAAKKAVVPYKTLQGFTKAMRSAGLTGPPEILRAFYEILPEEYTSAKAVEELYHQRGNTRRKQDRERKAEGKRPKPPKEKLRQSSAEQKNTKAERRKPSGAVKRRQSGTK